MTIAEAAATNSRVTRTKKVEAKKKEKQRKKKQAARCRDPKSVTTSSAGGCSVGCWLVDLVRQKQVGKLARYNRLAVCAHRVYLAIC